MTAVVCIYTPRGFVIAADGLRLKAIDGRVADEFTQKVFELPTTYGAIAYGCAGATLTPDGEKEFSFYAEVARTASRLPEMPTFDSFIHAILDGVYRAFTDFVTESQGSLDNLLRSQREGDRLFGVVIAGYFKEQPMRGVIEIIKQGRAFVPNVKDLAPARSEFYMHSGSNEALEIVRCKPGFQRPFTLREAMVQGRDYIQFCKDRRGSDPECACIGGHIHVAAITPTGFRWMIPPKKPTAQSQPLA